MQITELLIEVNEKTRPGIFLNKVKAIVLHYTAYPGGSARGVRKWYSMKKDFASAHYSTDDRETVRIIPEKELAYHVGANLYTAECQIWLGKSPNHYSIGIEMCIDAAGAITAATRARTLDLTVDLLRRHKLDHTDLWRHYDITTKPCPLPWVEKISEWFRFVEDVKAELARPPHVPQRTVPVLARPGGCIPA